MAYTVPNADRMAMYQRIFRSIPTSFLDPDHPNNQAVIGAIAYAVAYVEAQYQQFEAGLYLSSANNNDANDTGMTSLQRWGVWLDMTPQPGESPDAFRARLMTRLYSPRVTLNAISTAISNATGLTVTLVETFDEVVQMDAGPFEGKKLSGDVYGPMAIDIITEGATNVVPGLMTFLRAAGTHWRHIERVATSILLSLVGQPGSTTVSAYNRVFLFPPLARLDGPIMDHPPEPTYLYNGGESKSYDTCNAWSARTMLIDGNIAAPVINVEATSAPNPLWPVLNLDDATTLWGESVWGD